jgi:hypothetical protein
MAGRLTAAQRAYALIAGSAPEHETVSPPERLPDSAGRDCLTFLTTLRYDVVGDDERVRVGRDRVA